jgi:uracil phosphoribosyltransferase
MLNYKILLLGLIIMLINSPNNSNALQKHEDFPTLTIIDHPLVQHKLTLMRNKETSTYLFGQLLSEIAMLMGYEVTRNLETKDISIKTPMTATVGKSIDEENIVVVSILRAGIGMAKGLHQLIPSARQGHIGIYRDPKTKLPVEYYFKVPQNPNKPYTYIVVDPMLATGNTSSYAITKLINAGIPTDRIIFMALVAAPEGMKVFQKEHPGIPVYAASLDQKLDSHAYIIPGLGDAGDRLFGTK